ncbi:MAG: GAF domain-containing protein [Syntrophobacterales bacterium]|nr:GAF domain-containing protein [Syntrophobacterales bacterium]
MPRTLRRALELLAAGMEEGPFLQEVCRLALEAGGGAAVILLPREGRLRPAAWAGSLPPVFLTASFSLTGPPEHHPFTEAYQTGVAIRGDTLGEDEAALPWAAALREAELDACLAVPLRVAGRTLGVLAILQHGTDRPGAPWQDWLELVAVSAAAGIAARGQGEEGPRLPGEGASAPAGAAPEGWRQSWEDDAGIGRFEARLPGFRLTAATGALARMLGWEDPETLLREFVPAERVAEAAAWERLLAQAVGGRVAGAEVRFVRRDGQVAAVRLWGGWEGAREVFAGVAVDMSRLRELEEELAGLRRSHRLLREQHLGASLLSQAEKEKLTRELARERQVADAALAAGEAGVAAFTREGRLTHWSRGLEALTGLTREEVQGKELAWVLPGLKDALPSGVGGGPRRLLDPSRPVQLHPGAPLAGYDAVLIPLRDPRGEADGGILVLRHAPEAPAAPEPAPGKESGGVPGPPPTPAAPGEDAHRLRLERLEALGSLAGSLARDFDQILGVMLGYTEMAQAALPEEDPARRKLDQVLKAGRRGRELVQQILAFSRPWERRPPGPGARPEDAGEAPETLPARRRDRGRVLLAAGEEGQLDLWREILLSLGFEVHCARSGQEALELFRSQPQALDLLIADQDLAPGSGLELAQAVLAIRPGLPVILCLDPLDLLTLEKAKGAGVRDFAMKPWSLSELTAALDRILPPPGPRGLAP